VDGDIVVIHLKPFRVRHVGGFRGERHVEHLAAGVTVIVAVFLHVGAKTGGAPFQGHLPRQTTFDEGIQAVVNGGHGDFRHALFGADKDLFGGGMIAFFPQNIINPLTLRGETETAHPEPLVQVLTGFFTVYRAHQNNYTVPKQRVKN